ncbi:unnamed protein product, partial [Heterosigma akashiwo]
FASEYSLFTTLSIYSWTFLFGEEFREWLHVSPLQQRFLATLTGSIALLLCSLRSLF